MMKAAEGDFPVTFFDGEREISIGNVRVKSSLNFKAFQLGLSQRIGISPNQITVYLAGILPEHRRRVPITNKSDFSVLVRETGCYFLVVLKRTRRHRRPAPAPVPERSSGEMFAERMRDLQLRRENYVAEMGFGDGFGVAAGGYRSIGESLSDAREEGIGLGYQREANYVAEMVAGGGYFPTIRESLSDRPQTAYRRREAIGRCRQCEAAEWHHCMRDPVVVGFRTSAGPIAPPSRQ